LYTRSPGAQSESRSPMLISTLILVLGGKIAHSHGKMRGGNLGPKQHWEQTAGATSALRFSYKCSDGAGPSKMFPDKWPTLCPMGGEFWSKDELRAKVPEFGSLTQQKPKWWGRNLGGMGNNHGFALWFIARTMQPKYIIETGVFRGFGTWLLRNAAPNAIIFSLDPDPCVGRHKPNATFHPKCLKRPMLFADPSPKTIYMTPHGDVAFKDFAVVNWNDYIPKASRMETLINFDDHMSALRRVREMQHWGFEHMFYEDNYAAGNYPSMSCYSFNQLCVPQTTDTVFFSDRFDSYHRDIPLAEHNRNVADLQARIKVYYEFPAIYAGCRKDGRVDTLYTDFADVEKFGLQRTRNDGADQLDRWATLYPPYVWVRPNATLA
jgi:hypothetical protein